MFRTAAGTAADRPQRQNLQQRQPIQTIQSRSSCLLSGPGQRQGERREVQVGFIFPSAWSGGTRKRPDFDVGDKIRDHFQKACAAHVVPHDLRPITAVAMLEYTHDVREVQALLGHTLVPRPRPPPHQTQHSRNHQAPSVAHGADRMRLALLANSQIIALHAQATPRKTFPSSTALLSICSNTTNLPNAESRANTSKPLGIFPICSNYSESDMRRP